MTGGHERRDESVTFSLRELTRLEDERVEGERRGREDAERAARQRREDEEHRAREAREARAREEAEARERARAQEIEREAQREAMSRAAVEQARVSVEVRARAEEAERERAHELALARVRAEAKSGKPGVGAIVGAALVGTALAFGIATAAYAGIVKPPVDRRVSELEREVGEARTKAEALRRELDRVRGEAVTLSTRFAETKAALEREREAAHERAGKGRPKKHRGARRATPERAPKETAAPCVDEFDPMCGTISRPAN